MARTHDELQQPSLGVSALVGRLLVIVTALAAAHLARAHNYLLFHSLAEVFSIVIAAGAFMVAWNARDLLSSHYLLFLGVGYLAVGGLDLVHMLAFKGMGVLGVLGGDNADTPSQLWIAARYLQAGALAAAPAFLRRQMKVPAVLAVFGAAVAGVLAGIYLLDVFPSCFTDGVGLTPFRKVSEWVIAAILAAAAWLVYRERRALDPPIAWRILASIGLAIASELSFGMFDIHDHTYGVTNELGHVLKALSFYLFYRATIEGTLRRPYGSLFRELKLQEQALARSNQDLEGYAHTVSHDLRAPLASIAASADVLEHLLARGPAGAADTGQIERVARGIGSSARKAIALADDLLALAAAGQRPQEVDEVDVGEVVARVLEERAGTIRERSVHVEVERGLGRVRASPTHVYQVFANLISNAIRHNPSPAPRVCVRRVAGDGGHRFRVCDNGPGIPAELTEAIFAPFAKGPGGGHGLGLSMVRRVVGVYGGWIRAFNDNGACFELELHDL